MPFVLDFFSIFGASQAIFTPCGLNQSRLHSSPTRHGLRFPIRTVEEAGQRSLLFPQRASAVAVLDVSFSKFSLRSLQLGRIHPSVPKYLSGSSPAPQRPSLPFARPRRSRRPRPASGTRWRWRRRWGRCAAPEGGRTPPSGASIPTTLGEPSELIGS